jgi:hypothetical protein
LSFVVLLSICVFHENGLKKGRAFLPGINKIMFNVQLETACFDNKTGLPKAHTLQFCTRAFKYVGRKFVKEQDQYLEHNYKSNGGFCSVLRMKLITDRSSYSLFRYA